VAEVLLGGFANMLAGRGYGRTLRPRSAALVLVLSTSLVTLAVAQAPTAQAKKPPQSNPAPASDTPPPPPAQIWLPPVQTPEHAPGISWDGKLLTIDAENSSLADIMLGIRSRTGASIEMPASANRERVAVHLGPAPIREVLSSLLYGTDFNYVIQSSEDDESALGKVILISRDGDSSEDVVAADDTRPNRKVRLMPGYAAPGRRDFEVSHANATEEDSSAVADTTAADSSSSNSDQAPAPPVADSNATNTPPDGQPATSETADSNSSSDANTSTLTASGQPLTTGAASAGSGDSGTGGGSTIGEMEQNLQKMYQQRQQLQAQQNRPTQRTTP